MLFHVFVVKLTISTTGVTQSSEISISTFSISISISQLIFIDISISPISMTALICNSNHPKILINWHYSREMPPKDADGIANSENPDQTAPLGAV